MVPLRPPVDERALSAESGAARLHWWQHALALSAIAAVIVVRFLPSLESRVPLGDELAQERAFQLEASGLSPYTDGDYVYPPSLLRLDGLLRPLPLRSPYLLLRAASVLGLSLILWCASSWLAWTTWKRFGLTVLYVLFDPGVRQGIEFGNLSFAVGGLILLALLLEERSPVTTGVLLGASLLVKPLAPAAVLTLLFDRTRPGRWHWLAATVAVLFAGLPLLADPELAAFVTKGSSVWAIDRTVSLHRFLALSDHREAAKLLTIVLLVLVAFVARRFAVDRSTRLAITLAGCVTASPVVWNHTLVLTLPLQAMAFALAVARYRRGSGAARRERRWEVAGIGLAVAALTFAEGATGIDDRGRALQVLATLPPAIAPAALVAYVLRFHRPANATPAASTPADRPPAPPAAFV